jgi:hypothetical protein
MYSILLPRSSYCVTPVVVSSCRCVSPTALQFLDQLVNFHEHELWYEHQTPRCKCMLFNNSAICKMLFIICYSNLRNPKLNNSGNERINVTYRCVRVTIVAVEKQEVLHILCVCSLSYPTRKAHASYCIVNFGLSGCTIFFHIIS